MVPFASATSADPFSSTCAERRLMQSDTDKSSCAMPS